MLNFSVTSKVNRTDPEILVVHCSDYRFQTAFREFIDGGLRLKGSFDLLVIPGGPQCLTLVEYLPKFSWATGKWFRFLVDNHKLKRLILIAHQGCVWCETLPLHLHSSTEPRERQEEDLQRAYKTLQKTFPELGIELYYAGWDENDRITIEEMNLQ